MVLETLLGDTLVKNDGTEIKTAELSVEKGAVVGLYFSAHWCPPCRGFTPKLVEVYKKIKAAGKDFEIVLISWDSDTEQFKSYHGEMPWLAIPYDNTTEKDACNKKYQVRGIPTLVLLDASTGETLKEDGRDAIDTYGADAFPFTESRLAECKKEKQEAKEKALKELASFSFLPPITTLEDSESKLDMKTIMTSCESLAFTFLRGRTCEGSCVVLPKLLDVHETLGKEKLGIIIIALEELDNFSDAAREKMKNIPIIKFDEEGSKDVVNNFKKIWSSDVNPPHVFIIATGDESSMKIHADNAARDIYLNGAAGYPWSPEALEAKKAKEDALKKELKAKIENLEMFATGQNTDSYESHVVDKNGDTVESSTLRSNDVVGIYFSGHWCGPCRSFTPQLVEVYNKCKEQGNKFEVVFVSSDRDKAAFKEYYGEMPWLALSYDKRDMKDAISEVFEVGGIPTLVLLNGKGEVITEDGREAVQHGEEHFPWDKESLEKAKAEAPEKKRKALEKAKEDENKVISEQEEAKKIVIRRRIGDISNVTVSADHVIKFERFSTVAAPSAIVPSGKKVWYEVTFKEGNGVTQIGWATSDFQSSDQYEGNGVGDCTHSYGFDGDRVSKWHDGNSQWGKKIDPNSDHVLGVAADLENGKLLFGVDGDWNEPMGVAFEGIDKDIGIFPALTGNNMKLFVNFGGIDFKYGPPDSSYEKLKDVVENKVA